MHRPGFYKQLIMLLGALAAAVIGGGLSVSSLAESAEGTGAVPQLRRLNEQQYRNSVADVLGQAIEIKGRFEPELRTQGLLALGSSVVSVTPFGFEQFDTIGRSVARQYVEGVKRCPADYCASPVANAITSRCATDLLARLGGQLFRRPLSDSEQALYSAIVAQVSEQKGDIYQGLEAGLSGMLVAPPFLFRIEAVEDDPNAVGVMRLTGHAKAQRLSYFLWNTTPDAQLLEAAEKGDLHTRAGLKEQVDRLLESPRLEAGVRALFDDMLRFDEFDKLAKDPAVFPRFNFKAAAESREETLRTLVDHLLVDNRDYRDLFTTRKTFITSSLGLIYRVPVANPGGWAAYEFPPENHPKAGGRAGLLTQVSFLALHSHPGRSSATLRGKAVRELILCQEVPTPPANVDFSVVQDTDNPQFKTARERVIAHQTDAACASCHRITDPIGLALENFDGSGVYRATENGVAIDASGVLDGREYRDAVGLGEAVAKHPDTPACLVRRTFEVGAGRPVARDDRDWMKGLNRGFARSGYSLPALLRLVATSEQFFAPPHSMRVQPRTPSPTVAAALPHPPTGEEN